MNRQYAAPRDSASRPSAPVPANRSSTRAPLELVGEAVRQHVEQRLAGAVGGRADRVGCAAWPAAGRETHRRRSAPLLRPCRAARCAGRRRAAVAARLADPASPPACRSRLAWPRAWPRTSAFSAPPCPCRSAVRPAPSRHWPCARPGGSIGRCSRSASCRRAGFGPACREAANRSGLSPNLAARPASRRAPSRRSGLSPRSNFGRSGLDVDSLPQRLVARVLAALAVLDQPALADPAALAVAHDLRPLGELGPRLRLAPHRLVGERLDDLGASKLAPASSISRSPSWSRSMRPLIS